MKCNEAWQGLIGYEELEQGMDVHEVERGIMT